MLHAAPVIPETSPEHAPEQAPEEPRVARRRDRQHDDEANALVDAARYYLNHDTRGFRDDCSGFIEAVYARAGTPVHGSTAALWEQARARGATHRDRLPRPGDLAFFDNTYDRNRNGLVDDPLSHIAVVVSVDANGTVHMVHRGSRGIAALVLNTDHADERQHDGAIANDYLRSLGYGAADGPRLTAQLLRGFASAAGGEDGHEGLATDSVVAEHHAPRLPAPPREGPAEVTARDGLKVHRRDLAHADCDELWRTRNTVFARHGYRFQTEAAQHLFASRSWYVESPLVDVTTVDDFLTEADQRNLKRVLRYEDRSTCAD